MPLVAGREVKEWVSVAALLQGDRWYYYRDGKSLWPEVQLYNMFAVRVGDEIGHPGQIVVRELDGTVSIANWSDLPIGSDTFS